MQGLGGVIRELAKVQHTLLPHIEKAGRLEVKMVEFCWAVRAKGFNVALLNTTIGSGKQCRLTLGVGGSFWDVSHFSVLVCDQTQAPCLEAGYLIKLCTSD